MAHILLDEQLRCAKRELVKRRAMASQWVAQGLMTQGKATLEIACMAAIVETLTYLCGHGEPEHTLKCWPPYFADVARGVKSFELRRGDRPFRVGEWVRLQEWRPDPEPDAEGEITYTYTGQEVTVEITYLLDGDWPGLTPGYVILGIQRVA